jgi:hypothetical protein
MDYVKVNQKIRVTSVTRKSFCPALQKIVIGAFQASAILLVKGEQPLSSDRVVKPRKAYRIDIYHDKGAAQPRVSGRQYQEGWNGTVSTT